MRKFITKKRVIWTVVVIIVAGVGYLIFRPKPVVYKEFYTVADQNIRQTVIATGTVTSESDLSLSFKSSGILGKLNVKVGEKVKAGQTLAVLDQKDALAAIAQAEAEVLAAKANLQKVINGTSDPEILVAQVAVDNALSAWLNSTPQALPNNDNTTATVSVTGTYTGTEQGSYVVELYNSANGISYRVSGLGNISGTVTRNLDLPIGGGLYINFADDGFLSTITEFTISIPNPQASDYLTNLNAYKAAQTNLAQKKASARSEDILAAEASVASAEARLLIARNNYSENILSAPINGQVTTVNIKLGEQVSALTEALVLLDPDALYVESFVPESSIGLVSPGQSIDMTLDAFGPDKHLTGEVLSIDPASVVDSGVIQFRVISSLPIDQNIRPGMTVNLNIIIADKPNTLALPNRLIRTAGGKKTVMVLKNGELAEQEISTGLAGDNYTEIVSGLSAGDIVVVLAK